VEYCICPDLLYHSEVRDLSTSHPTKEKELVKMLCVFL
jgi:hypothetical protein